MFSFEPQKAKEYRPYLGSESAEPEGNEHSSGSTVIKHKKRKRKILRFRFIKRYIVDLQNRRKQKQKQKQKRKRKKSYLKTKRKEQRIKFIQRFYPSYKKQKEEAVDLFLDEEPEEKEKSRHANYLKYLVNSLVLYVVAYLLVYILYQFAVLIVASNWKLDSILFYYDLAFNDFSPLWNRRNIIIVTFSGPFLSLILGFLFMRYFARRPKYSKQARLFMLWIGLHGFNFFLGAFASGVSFDEGFGYVPAWLFMNIFWKILFSMVFLFLLGVVGYNSVPRFLETSYSRKRIRPQNKNKFLLFQVALPWIIGSLIIFLVKIPSNMPYDVGIMVTMLFGVVPIFFNKRAKPTKHFKIEKRGNQFNYLMIAVVVAIILLYRIGLNNGLHFQLYYDFIFSLKVVPI
jgi:hypothetical protein